MGEIKNVVNFAGTKLSCAVSDVVRMLSDEKYGDRELLEFAGVVKFGNCPRAEEYLAHYLNGSGSDKMFRLGEMLNDSGVRGVIKRHFQSPSCNGYITIRQQDYSDDDWRNSLGTYYIMYIDVGLHKNINGKLTKHVLAWGADVYRWHPDDERRFTQCLHKAASRLLRPSSPFVKKAAEFRMLATDTVIDTESCREAPNVLTAVTVKHMRASDFPQISKLPYRPVCRK